MSMNFVADSSAMANTLSNQSEHKERKGNVADKRLFMFLVALSFPIFLMVATERRMAGAINKEISAKQKSLFTDAKEYAVSTIALALSSQ